MDIKKDEFHYKGHLTFWQYAKPRYHIERPTKYCVIFNTWKDNPESFSCTEFNTLDDALDEAKELNKMYSSTPKPIKVYDKNGRYKDGLGWKYNNYNWDFSEGRIFWGYAVLDMINCKFIRIVNGLKNKAFNLPEKPALKHIDIFFREDNEIPEDYLWDNRGEYEGWLQFRWGDGKNAIDYIEPEKEKKSKSSKVVIVNWDNPLPEKIKGVKYMRPNKEPVLFPGDFGYEGDEDNPNPWSLAEEIAYSEYEEENKTSSIADILGDDNPLLKLKFD